MKMEGFEIRPRLVWGRRPRVNGGRRRPRGWMGRYKLRPVVSRASYPAPAPRPQLPPAPRLDEFTLHIDPFPPTGNVIMDSHLEHLSVLYGGISRIRCLLLARAEVLDTSGVYRAQTGAYWKRHDEFLRAAESLRQQFLLDYGVEAPGVPERFYWKF